MYEETIELTPAVLQRMRMAKIFKDYTKEINVIDFSNDGTQLVGCDDTSIHIYDVLQGKKTRTLYNKVREIDQVKFTHNNSAILCVSKKEPYEIYYWSLHDNEIIKKFVGHTDTIYQLEMSPTSDIFLTCSRDMTLRLWNLNSNDQECDSMMDLSSKKTHCIGAFEPTGVAFAVSYQEVYSGASICRVYLYDLVKYESGSFNSWKYECPELKILKFSPSGKEILGAAQDNYIMILDAFTGQKLCEITDYQNDNTIIEASFSPDSKYVISGSETGHLYIWTCDKGELVAKLEGHMNPVRVVKFNPVMAMIASGCKNIVFWLPTQIDQNEEQNQIKQQVN